MGKTKNKQKRKQQQPEQKLLLQTAYLSFAGSFFSFYAVFYFSMQKFALIFIYAREIWFSLLIGCNMFFVELL